jgi:hypothetical protein
MRKHVAMIIQVLTEIHPFYFLIIYVSLIPVFGLIYRYYCPEGFYAPYVRLEPAWIEDTSDLSLTLTNR